MKLVLGLAMMILAPQFALAENTLYCRAAGNTNQIIKLIAHEYEGTVRTTLISQASITTTHSAPGSLKTEFQVALIDRLWQGVDSVALKVEDGKYSLKTTTSCNFSYQEEHCFDGELLSEKTDSDIECSLVD